MVVIDLDHTPNERLLRESPLFLQFSDGKFNNDLRTADKNPTIIFGDEANDLITRLSGTLVVFIMCAAFYFYVIHSEVILSFELFKNEKIGLSALGIYFALRGNN